MQKIETSCKNEIKLIEGWYNGPEDSKGHTGAKNIADGGSCGTGNGNSNVTKTKLNEYKKTANDSTHCKLTCPYVKTVGSGASKYYYCSASK